MLQDTWALKAQREGYRSRAVYKLEEIMVKVKYNNHFCKVLDIGCAPGGWSDYMIKKYPKSFKITDWSLETVKMSLNPQP